MLDSNAQRGVHEAIDSQDERIPSGELPEESHSR
jgi:hypothetical protein